MSRLAVRAAAAAAVVSGILVGPGIVAAHAVDLGSESIDVHIDNNNLVSPLCITIHISSKSQGNILGPTTICLP